jgi:two-component system chemotaxis response regulator CheY
MADSKLRFLVVDDFSTMRRIVKTMLKQLGYEHADEAKDGQEALEMLKRGRYDVVVSDWNMPNMNGVDLLKSIRADDELKALGVLMVTAETEKTIVVEAIKAGVNNYIVKPFTPDVFEEKLKKVLEKIGK